jgi:hypothetical protein
MGPHRQKEGDMEVFLYFLVPLLAVIVLLVWVNRGNHGRFRKDVNAVDQYLSGRDLFHGRSDPSDRRQGRS